MKIKWIILLGGTTLITIIAIVLAVLMVLAQSSAYAQANLLASVEVMGSQTVSALINDQATSDSSMATAEMVASQTISALNDIQTTSKAGLATVEMLATQTISGLENIQSTSDKLLVDAKEKNDVASTAQANLSSVSKDQISEINTQATRISSLERVNICRYVPDTIDYSSSRAASNSIKAWLEDTEGMIDEAIWNPLWQNTKVNIHYFTSKEDAFYVFIVYFDDDDHQNSVLDVYNNCWLDR